MSHSKVRRVMCAWAAFSMVMQPVLAATPVYVFQSPLVNHDTSAIRGGTLVASAASLSFGTLTLGGAASRMLAVSNTGQEAVDLENISVSAPFTQSNNCPSSLVGGATCSVTVGYAPGAEGSSSSALHIQGTNSSLTIPVSGSAFTNASHLTLSENAISLGEALIGVTAPVKQLSITNTGVAEAVINGIGIDNSAEFTQSNNCAALAPGATCQVNLAFTPAQYGGRSGNLNIYEQQSGALYSVSLTGTGSGGILGATSASVNFGSVIVGRTPLTAHVTLTNSGNRVITNVTPELAEGDFEISSSTCNTGVPAGGACDLTVQFNPLEVGARTATLRINSAAAGSVSVALTGTATAQAPKITSSVSTLTFADTGLEASTAAQAVTFTNAGNVPVTVSGVTLSNGASNFSMTHTCAATLAIGASCTANVVFSPTQAGSLSGQLALASSAGATTINLSGVGAQGIASVSRSEVSFAATQVASTSAPQIVTVTNTGNKPLAISAVGVAVGNDVFAQSNNCATVAAGGNCTISLTFTPTQVGSALGTLALTHDGSGLTLVNLSGLGQGAAVTLSQPSFEGVAVGQTTTGTATLTNTGIGPLTVAAPQVTGDGFTMSSSSCAETLTAGNSCSIVVQFKPTTTSASSGALSVTTNAGAKTVSFGSTGLQGFASVSANSISFGQQQTGSTSAVRNITVTNTGTNTLTLAGVGVSAGADDFAQNNNCATVAVGASCTISVNFTPSVDGTRTGALSLVHDGGGVANVELTGIGQTPSATLSAVSFSATSVGSSSTAQSTLTNTGTAPLAVTPPDAGSVTGTGYSFASTTCGTSVPVNGTCTTTVRFSPQTTGAASGSLSISTGAGMKSVGLGSTGIQGFASINPSTLIFSDSLVGNSQSQTVTVTNTGTDVLTFTGVGIYSGSTDYTQTNGCLAVAVGGTCSVTVTFNPSALNARLGILAFTHNGGGIALVDLVGNGIQPASVTTAAFSANTVSVGGSSTFTWATSNAASASVTCTAPAVGTATGLSGSLTVTTTAAGTGSCTVTATNSAGNTVTGSANLAVVALPTVTSASFSPSSVLAGTSSTFSWNTSGGDSASVVCAGKAVGAGSGLSGSIPVTTSTSGSGTCTVTVQNVAGATATQSATLTVGTAPTVTGVAFANAYTTTGSTNMLSYTTSNANSVSVSCANSAVGSSSAASGPLAVTATGTAQGTCTVNATNSFGTTSGQASFTAVAAPVVTTAAFIPASVNVGTGSTFTWSTTGASSASVACDSAVSGSASGVSGSLAINTSIAGSGTCTITALNLAGSSVSASASLSIVEALQNLVVSTELYSSSSTTIKTKITITNPNASAVVINYPSSDYMMVRQGYTCYFGSPLAGGDSCFIIVSSARDCNSYTQAVYSDNVIPALRFRVYQTVPAFGGSWYTTYCTGE